MKVSKTQDALVNLKTRLDQLDGLATEGSLLSHEDKDRVSALCGKGREALVRAGQTPLRIGLLGGTGVGKSSIINSLAGQVISVVSHKRPYTDKVVVYCHEEIESGFGDDYSFLAPPAKHGIDKIKHIIICDLPDYDSLVKTHHQMVMDFTVELDLLIWVTSPEKYADGAMWELMKLLKKSSKNFSFVLNKRDELSEEDLVKVMGRFTIMLQQSFTDSPRIFALSAKEAFAGDDSPGSREFHRFASFVFKERREKELLAIKAANVEEELDDLVQGILKSFSMGRDIQRLIKALEEVEEDLGSLKETVRYEVLDLVDPNLDARLFNVLEDRDTYLWPVKLANNLLRRFMPSEKKIRVSRETGSLPEYIKALDNRLNSAIVGLACDVPTLSMAERLDGFVQKNRQSLDILTELSHLGQRGTRFFILRQWLYLGVPVIFFFFHMLGAHQVSDLSEFFDPLKIIHDLFNLPLRLFQGYGAVAFASLVLIEGVISIYLSSMKLKRLSTLVKKVKAKIGEGMACALMGQLIEEFSLMRKWSQRIDNELKILKGEG